jgi:hypothetical protein
VSLRTKVVAFLFGHRRSGTPILMTSLGEPVTESARLAAAIRMRDNREVRQRVEAHLIEQYGSVMMGLKEARRRYPECYTDVED